MNNKLNDPYGMNSGIVSAMRQAEEMRKLVEVPEHIKSAMELTNSFLEEQQRIEEMQRISAVPDYMKSAMDKMNLIPDLGFKSALLDEQKRIEEMQRAFTVPSGIVGMVQESLAQTELKHNYLYPEPRNVSVEIPIYRPPPDPMHKVTKILEKHEQNQTETNSHLKVIASQGEGTSKQNDKMLFWAKVAAIGTIAGLLIGYLSYQAGKSSSTPVTTVAPVAKAVPAPVMPPAPAPAPVNTKK